MSTSPPSSGDDARLARLVLPTLDDMGPGRWMEEPGDDSGGPSSSLADACLPEDFPDAAQVADAEIGFARDDGAALFALSTVFDSAAAATQAWSAVMSEAFARCFAESVGDQVDVPGPLTLLGPVVRTEISTLEPDRVMTATHRAVFAEAGADSVTPVLLRYAAVAAGRALVVLWALDRGEPSDDEGWGQLVTRVGQRCEAALEM